MTSTSNSAPDWLDRMLSEPPVNIPDEGFSKRVARRIRARKRVRVVAILGSALAGLVMAVVLGAGDGLVRLVDALGRVATPERFGFLNKLPLPDMPQMPDAAAFSSPLVLTVIGVTALLWLFREEV